MFWNFWSSSLGTDCDWGSRMMGVRALLVISSREVVSVFVCENEQFCMNGPLTFWCFGSTVWKKDKSSWSEIRSPLFWSSDELRQVKCSTTLSFDLWPRLIIVQNIISSYFDQVDINGKKRWTKNPETASPLPAAPETFWMTANPTCILHLTLPTYNILAGTEQQKQNPPRSDDYSKAHQHDMRCTN